MKRRKFVDLYNYCAANGKKDRGESRQPNTKLHALYGSESEGGKRISKCGCQRLFIRRYISSCKKHLIYFEWPHNISREKNRSTRCHNDEGWRNRLGKVGILLPFNFGNFILWNMGTAKIVTKGGNLYFTSRVICACFFEKGLKVCQHAPITVHY